MKAEPTLPEQPVGDVPPSRFPRMRLGPWRHAITALFLASVLAIVRVALSKFAGFGR